MSAEIGDTRSVESRRPPARMAQLILAASGVFVAVALQAGCSPTATLRPTAAPRPLVPQPAKTAYLGVEERLGRGELRAARKLARAALAEFPGDGHLACELAEIELELGDYDAAEARLRSLIQAASPSANGQPSALLTKLERLRKSPEHPNGLRLLEAAWSAASRGQVLEARRLGDRGMTELEQQTGASVAAEVPRPYDSHVLALEASPSAHQLAVADSHGLSLLDAAFEETRHFSLLCSHLSWPTEHALLCGTPDGRVLGIDPASAQARELARLRGPVTSVSGQDGNWLATGGGRAIGGSADASVWELDVTRASAGSISPSGERLAIGREDGSVSVFDVATRQEQRRITAPPGEPIGRVEQLRFSDDGQWLGLTLQEGRARVLSATTGKLRALLPFTGDVRLSPDGQLVIAAGVTYAVTAPRNRNEAISAQPPLMLEPGGRAFFSVTEDGALLKTQVNGEASAIVRPAPEALDHGWPTTLRALTSMLQRNGHYAPESEADVRSSTSGCNAEAISQDGRYALCLQGVSDLTLQDRQSARALWRVPSPLLPVGPLELSVDHHLVLVGSARAEAALLSWTDGRLLARVVLTNVTRQGGELVARGYATNTQGKLQFFGADSARFARWARCGIGPFRLPFELCRSELLDASLLQQLLEAQK